MIMAVVLGILYAVIPGIQFALFMMDLPFFRVFDTVNYLLSIISYYWICNHLLITVKLPLLQRRFPYDRLIKFHVITGTTVVVSLGYHVLYKLIAGKQIDLLSWGLLVLFAGLFVLAVLWIEAPLFRHIRRRILKRSRRTQVFSYDLLKIIHGYLFLGLGILSYIHIDQAGMLDSSFTFAAVYPTIYLIMVVGLVLFSKVRKALLPRLRLVKNEAIKDISVLTFEPAKISARPLRYTAGQFGYISWRSKGLSREEHPFSFLSAPSDENISLGIKGLGDYTGSLATISPGSIARINGGFGNFVPNFTRKRVCLIGSGIGIVPIVSLIREMRYHPPTQEVIALIAVNTRTELLAEHELREVERLTPGLALHLFVYDEDKVLYSPEVLRSVIPDPESRTYYICSSENVRKIILEALGELGVHLRQTYFEAFTY